MRTLRTIQPGAIYHITARANHKEKVLKSPIAKDLFVETLEKMRRKHDCGVVDFVVMDNHIHLLLQPRGDSSLPAIMKWLLGVYTMNYNRVFKTWGHVWGGRYYSRHINGLIVLANTIVYVDRNPVRAFLADRAEDWEWGGLYIHRGGRREIMGEPPAWLLHVAPNHERRRLGV
jgi:putative transposase